ncbi:MAG: nodulation protein NfeD [candidate division Zixibacteria bacterium]
MDKTRYRIREKSRLSPFVFTFLLLVVFLSFFQFEEAAANNTGRALRAQVDMPIGPIALRIIEGALEQAIENDDDIIIFELNTPGGLDASMRPICRKLLNADIPTVVYVSPSGAHAASAGLFIAYSAHIAAMAPGTNIGAAHGVNLGGEMDSVMTEKIQNDAVAYITSIAKKRNRNITWAEAAVRESASIDAEAALDSNVIDILAKDFEDLLNQLDGRIVSMPDGEDTLAVAGAVITDYHITFKNRFLSIITNPTVAFILFNIGWLGLMIELYNPGAILPGVVGGISLLLAFFSFQQLPINYAGLGLIIFAVILFVLEIKIVSHGVLAIGGVISMLLGSFMLIDSPEPYLQISMVVIVTTVLAISAFFLFIVGFAIKAHRRKVATGQEGIIGGIGVVREGGMVFVEGELWRADCEQELIPGDKVKVEKFENMRLKVIKLGGER